MQAELLQRINELTKLVHEKNVEIEHLESVVEDDQLIIGYLKNKIEKPLIDVEDEFGIKIENVMKVHDKYDELRKRCEKEEQEFINYHGEMLDVNDDEAEEFLEIICNTEQFKNLQHKHENKLDKFLEKANTYLFKKSDIKYNDDNMCDKFDEWFNNEF